jgi:hypothetical protein
MLGFNAYRMLSPALQAEILSEYGVDLQLVRLTAHHEIVLYALDGFYVEVFFDRKTEELLFLKPFNRMKHLDVYLPMIDIEGLFEVK